MLCVCVVCVEVHSIGLHVRVLCVVVWSWMVCVQVCVCGIMGVWFMKYVEVHGVCICVLCVCRGT